MKKKCVHYWVIESPNGKSTSKGECKFCGAKKTFSNLMITEPSWTDFTMAQKELEAIK